MKIILSLLATIVSLSGFAQVSSYTVFADSLFGCTPIVSIAFSCGPVDDNATITFDWGDGTIDNQTVFIAANTNSYISFPHSYANSGTYSSETQVYSANLGANIDAGEINALTVSGATTCGLTYIQTLQVPGIYYTQVPLDFTDNLGVTTTITPSLSGNTVYEGLNPANAPYNVSINDAWLLTHSFTQASNDITISSFDAQGYAVSSSYQLEVTCNGTVAQPDFMVAYGFPSNFVAPLQSGLLQLNLCNISCSNSDNATVNITMPSLFVPNTNGLKLTDFWKSVTNAQWKQLLAIPEAKDFKDGFEYIR